MLFHIDYASKNKCSIPKDLFVLQRYNFTTISVKGTTGHIISFTCFIKLHEHAVYYFVKCKISWRSVACRTKGFFQ